MEEEHNTGQVRHSTVVHDGRQKQNMTAARHVYSRTRVVTA